jgi:hypothetical protein
MRAIESETVDGIVFPSLIRASAKKNREDIVAEAPHKRRQISSNERTPLAETKKPRFRGAPLPFTLSQAQARHVVMWMTAARLSWQMSPAAPRQQHRDSSQKVGGIVAPFPLRI